MTEQITTYIVDMPTTIHSYVVSNADTTFCIIINARLSYEAQLEAYKHEIGHIWNGDFDKNDDVGIIEINAHSTN